MEIFSNAFQVLDAAASIVLGKIVVVTQSTNCFTNDHTNETNNLAELFSSKYLLAKEISHIHYSQKSDWDCGIACVVMVRQWFHKPYLLDHDIHSDTLMLSRNGRPLWTIELLLTLSDWGIQSCMYTLSYGSLDQHQSCEWYKETMEEDTVFVQNAFKTAEKMGLRIENKSILASQLKSSLDNPNYCIAIILINNLILRSRDDHDSSVYDDNYKGHYILLLVYDETDDSFLYLDPAENEQDNPILRVSSPILEAARKHRGTDEDIIFCHRA